MKLSGLALMCVGVSIVFGCAANPGAPASAGNPAQPKDPQASYEPRSGPGEGQRFLARMEGDWDVVKTFYPRSGDPAVTQGTCRQRMIHEGRFLESDFVFHDANGETTGTGMIGFDPQGGKFTSFWVDSRSTRFSLRGSEEPFDGQKILLWSQTVGAPGPNARRSRTISTLEDGDRKLVHRQFSVAADGTERIVMQMEMMRKR